MRVSAHSSFFSLVVWCLFCDGEVLMQPSNRLLLISSRRPVK